MFRCLFIRASQADIRTAIFEDTMPRQQKSQFIHSDLGHRKKGEIVEVTLSAAANVRLMDSPNFQNYRNGRKHQYRGGLVKRSPFRIQIPHSGHWHLAVDMQGMRGSVRASTRILPSPLPEAKETPLSSVPSLVHDDTPPNVEDAHREYDVFISHASDDKEAIVKDLAEALRNVGLRVWYDNFELKIGDSLRQKIDRGLANSRVGLVVLSQSFVNKGWANYELDGIVSRSVDGAQTLLPIWHQISKKEVMEFSPSLADKVARNTATHTVEEIAEEIAELLNEDT